MLFVIVTLGTERSSGSASRAYENFITPAPTTRRTDLKQKFQDYNENRRTLSVSLLAADAASWSLIQEFRERIHFLASSAMLEVLEI